MKNIFIDLLFLIYIFAVVWIANAAVLSDEYHPSIGQDSLNEYDSRVNSKLKRDTSHDKATFDTWYQVPTGAKKWFSYARTQLDKKAKMLKSLSTHKKAKNIVFYLGDGMSLASVTTGRIYKKQTPFRNKNDDDKEPAEAGNLAFDLFDFTGLAKTYNDDHQIPDSAGTATAFLCGSKARFGTLGISPDQSDCSNFNASKLTSIAKMAKKLGKSVGILTTTDITHATPAATYCHTIERNYDSSVPDGSCPDLKDIASQLVTNANDFDVILGGGLIRLEQRPDGQNITQMWADLATDKEVRKIVYTREQLLAIKPSQNLKIMGVFGERHLEYHELRKEGDGTPSLSEMVTKATEILKLNPNGYFLLVEAGRIDHAHHDTQAKLAAGETVEMSRAMDISLKMATTDDTLFIATADHGHTMVHAGGYSDIGNPIVGISVFRGKPYLDSNGLVFTNIVYANGPGYIANRTTNLTEEEVQKYSYIQESVVPMNDSTHGGEDVPVYASGPMSHMLTGVFDQSYIAHAVMYSLCSQPYHNEPHCKDPEPDNSAQNISINWIIITTLTFISLSLI